MLIGFSTGSLALGDFRRGLEMSLSARAPAIELSALREDELDPLAESLDSLPLDQFEYVSFHAPSQIKRYSESELVSKLRTISRSVCTIVVHPDLIASSALWRPLGERLCVENMDKRKPTGRTSAELQAILAELPEAELCFDIGHARQIDPTMLEAAMILKCFNGRIRQMHLSHVNSNCGHEPLNFESLIAFQRVARLIPRSIPIILETPVQGAEMAAEIAKAHRVLHAPDSAFADVSADHGDRTPNFVITPPAPPRSASQSPDCI